MPISVHIITAIVAAIIHYVLQFLAWGFAPGNTVPGVSMPIFSQAWSFLSFPMFWLTPNAIVDKIFSIILVINSMVWGVSFTTIIAAIRMRLNRPKK